MTASKRTLSGSPERMRTVSIVGTGSALPERIITNAELEKMVETTDEWITSRTGIRERRVAAADQYTSDLGAEAARKALADAKLPVEKVDLILCATITPDMPFPCTAALIQDKLGAPHTPCFDIEAACTGFVYGMEIGRQFVMTGTHQNVLVIAAEKLSSIVDWKDRNSCVLFGDGAGAAVLQHVEGVPGILSTSLGAHGKHGELLCQPGGGSRHPATEKTVQERLHYLKMTGREVYKHAVLSMFKATHEALERANLSVKDIACVIPHQANRRILEGLAERLEIGMDRFYINLDRYGNMSAASAAVALDEAAHEGFFKRGDAILIVAFGAGFTWGATVLRW